VARVAVIQGGPSSEAEVSRVSARAVAEALRVAGHEPTLLELGPALLGELSHRTGAAEFEVVFPVVHGALGEDGCLQGVLEILGVPYVGSGVLASATAMDKVRSKVLFRAAGLPIAEDIVVHRGEDPRLAAARAQVELGPAVVIKPATQGSALGVAVLTAEATVETIAAAIEEAFRFDEAVLIEARITGRELTCGVTDVAELPFTLPPPATSVGTVRALPPTEIVPIGAEFYDFQAKYGTGGSRHVCPAELPTELFDQVQTIAVAAHRLLGCRDLSRADFIVGTGEHAGRLVLLEVNTMPGMTATSLYPEAMDRAGISFSVMCDRLIRAALGRRVADAVPIPAMPA
jgi:D-alanine-D-alanine ligase